MKLIGWFVGIPCGDCKIPLDGCLVGGYLAKWLRWWPPLLSGSVLEISLEVFQPTNITCLLSHAIRSTS